ncbi:Drgx: Dorsal root ganglia homeobox protein [Crotalus adamanteus]|uniref:Drgx: Dorsal root ganglia homeobox protein n=1 Tax=Crotalus adamanteus TaxID=8729 RepID=A0AAW1BH81_CROAD
MFTQGSSVLLSHLTQVWFQNRRAKWRKTERGSSDQEGSKEAVTELTPPGRNLSSPSPVDQPRNKKESLDLQQSLSRAVGPSGSFFPSCLPGALLNSATYAQALSQVASLKGKRPRVCSVFSGNRLTECHGAGWALLAEPVFLNIMFGLHG